MGTAAQGTIKSWDELERIMASFECWVLMFSEKDGVDYQVRCPLRHLHCCCSLLLRKISSLRRIVHISTVR